MSTVSNDQIESLRAEFGVIAAVNPDRLADFHRIFQLARAGIRFVSKLAVNAYPGIAAAMAEQRGGTVVDAAPSAA